MDNWTIFGSDSDLQNSRTSDKSERTCYTPKYQPDKLVTKPSCNLSKLKILDFDPLESSHERIEECKSLPSRNPITRCATLSSTKCSSSCENLDGRNKVFSVHNDIPPPLHPKLCKSSSDNPLSPPVLPPRDYTPGSKPNQNRPKNAEIHPVVMNGHQLTHTHYWLLPDKLPREISSECKKPEMYINVVPPTPQSPGVVTARSAPVSAGSFDSSMNSTSRRGILRKTPAFGSLGGSDRLCLLTNEADVDTVSIDTTDSSCGLINSCDMNHFGRDEVRDKTVGCGDKKVIGDDVEGMSMKEVKDLIEKVQCSVEGVSIDESYTALSVSSWKVDAAIKYLKVEQLFRLGLASRAKCQCMLQGYGWNVELAASALVDEGVSIQRSASAKESSRKPAAKVPEASYKPGSNSNLVSSSQVGTEKLKPSTGDRKNFTTGNF